MKLRTTAIIFGTTLAASVHAQPIDLGTLGGNYSQPYAINEAGQVTGYARTTSGRNHAFRWTEQTGMVDLTPDDTNYYSYGYEINQDGAVLGTAYDSQTGRQTVAVWQADGTELTLPGSYDYAYVRSWGQSMNEAGTVVGYARRNSRYVGFIWNTADGTVTELDPAGSTQTYLWSINEAGQAVGEVRDASGSRAIRWTADGGITDLGTLGGNWSYAYRINEAGAIMGRSRNAANRDQVFYWTEADGMQAVDPFSNSSYYWSYVEPYYHSFDEDGSMAGYSYDGSRYQAFHFNPVDGLTIIDTSGANHAYAFATRNGLTAGRIDGNQNGSYTNQAFSWNTNDGLTEIPGLGGTHSYAYHVTEGGGVVGTAYLSGNSSQHPFEWTASGGTLDLGTLESTNYDYAWTQNGVDSSNARGQIIGTSYTGTSYAYHAVIFQGSSGADTTPPVLTLNGADLLHECATGFADPGATALDDVDGDLSAQIVVSGSVDAANPGTYTLEYSVSDAAGNTATASRSVTVEDSTPPTVSDIAASPAMLWPPNHKLVGVNAAYSAADSCSATVTCSLHVVSNEPVNGSGDGNTDSDWLIYTDTQVSLRAERSGQGDGRIYGLTASCTDASGNLASGAGEVSVPRSRGKGKGKG